jgi:hypothetical protein
MEGDAAGPGVLGGGDHAGVRRLVATQERQVEEHDQRLADHHRGAAGAAAHGRCGGGVDFGVDAARLDVAYAVLADVGDAQQPRASAGGEGDDVAGLEREAAQRQGELRALARRPGFEQPGLDGAGGVLGLQNEREIGGGDATAAAGEAACFLDGGGIDARGGDVGELGGGRQIGLLCAREGGERLVGALLDEGIDVERGGAGTGAAVREDDGAIALAGVEEEGELERLQGLASGQHAVDDEAGDEAGQRAGVVVGKAVVGEQC